MVTEVTFLPQGMYLFIKKNGLIFRLDSMSILTTIRLTKRGNDFKIISVG